MEKLFVYGTLRSPARSASGDRVVDKAVAADTRNYEFVADEVISSRPATLVGADLLSFIHYPGIKPGEGTVIGELFELTTEGFEICDGIESHPDFFSRTRVSVSTDDGEVEAWTYWAPTAMLAEGHPIPSGDWFDRDRSRTDGRTLDEALAEDRTKQF